jgi:hypothetical protein
MLIPIVTPFKKKIMKNKLALTALLLPLFFLQSCFLEEEDCELTGAPITDESLSTQYDANGNFQFVPVALYKVPKSMELYYSLGSCGPNDIDTNWEYTGDHEVVDQNSSGRFTAKFYTSGTICGQFTGNGQATDQACQPIKVLTDNIWAPGPDFPAEASVNTVTLNINNEIYSGFGNTNVWYKLDTLDFSWEEMANVSNVAFTSFAGFSLNGKGYIVGSNSLVYEYDPVANSWASVGEFPVNVTEYLLLQGIGADRYFYSILGAAVGGKGYFGLGYQNRLWEFDPTTKLWTEKANYPETQEDSNYIFPYKNRIYVGEYYYDIATDIWVQNSYDFKVENGFGINPVEMNGLIYGSYNAKTMTYDGNTVEIYEPRPHEPYEPFAPNTSMVSGAALGNLIIYPRASYHLSSYTNNPSSIVTIYRK